MKQLLSTLSHSTRRYLAALTLLFLFSACTQTPTPDNNNTPNAIQTSDEDGNNATARAVPVNGLKGDYYNNMDFTGTLVTRYDANVNRSWGTAAPIAGIANTTYSVRWTGQIQPQFSQEYTFFVTSSGGARLMVNGQVLVNNWTDHASKVDSGKVTLQANVKYDIRLEFFRNTVNPAVIKLEWQSASRARQVVPQARLFTTGSNSQLIWSKAKALIPAGLSGNLDNALSSISGDFQLLWIPDANRAATMLFAFKGSFLALARHTDLTNERVLVTNLLNNRNVDFGTLTQYSLLTKNQKWNLERNLYSGFEGVNIAQNSGRITLQQVPSSACPTCQALYQVYALNHAAFVTFVAVVEGGVIASAAVNQGLIAALRGVVTPGMSAAAIAAVKDAQTKAWWTVFTEVMAIVGATGWLGQAQGLIDQTLSSLNAYNDCASQATCEPKISNPTPNPLKLEGKVGGFAEGSVTAQNIGFWGLRPTVSSGSSWLQLTMSGLNGNVLPENGTVTIFAKVQCDTVGITFASFILETTTTGPDPTYLERKPVDVEIKCIGAPKLTANPLTLDALLNTSADGVIIVKNDGSTDLNITQATFVFTESLAGALFSVQNITGTTLIPLATKDVAIKGTCGATVGILEGELILVSNDPTSPKVVTATLNCKGPSVEGITGRVDGPDLEWVNVTPVGKFAFKNTSPSGVLNYELEVEGATTGDYSIDIQGSTTGTLGAGATATISLTGQCANSWFGGTVERFIQVKEANGEVLSRVKVQLNCYMRSVAASFYLQDECGSTPCYRGAVQASVVSATDVYLVGSDSLRKTIGIDFPGQRLPFLEAYQQATDFVQANLQVPVLPGYRICSDAYSTCSLETWESFYTRLKLRQGFN